MSRLGVAFSDCGFWGLLRVSNDVARSLGFVSGIFFCLRWTLLDSDTGIGAGLVTGALFVELLTVGPVKVDESDPTISPPLEWSESGVVMVDAAPSERGRTILAGAVKFDLDDSARGTTRVKELIGFPPRLDGLNECECEELL